MVSGVNVQSTHSGRHPNLVRMCVYTLVVKSEEYGYGGLLVSSNTYSLSKDDHLYDVENDEIPIRNLRYLTGIK